MPNSTGLFYIILLQTQWTHKCGAQFAWFENKTYSERLDLRAWKGSASYETASSDGSFGPKPSQTTNLAHFVWGIQYEYTGLGFPNCLW